VDINRARQQLLNRFPQRYRQHILDFASNLSALDADVLIFTARKAACFFHCLEHLRLWSAGTRVVTTDRHLDHDSGWVQGKRVAVIDEVIVSGTSLYRLKSALIAAGAAQITIHALFINKDWFVGDFFADGTLAESYIELDGPDAQALGTIIVRAFQCLPRPYSIDYPMSGWITLSEHSVDLLTCLPGWNISIADEQWLLSDGKVGDENLEFFRFEPSSGLHDTICQRIGVGQRDIALLKIRTYGRWDVAEGKRTYHFRMVPYVVLGELDKTQVDDLFCLLIAELDVLSQAELTYSCLSGKSRLRVIQYVLAARLARVWSEHCSMIGLRIPFVEDQRELSFVFPASVSPRLALLCGLKSTKSERELPKFESAKSGSGEFESVSQTLSAAQFFSLSEIFLKLYLEEEIPERVRARVEGLNYFASLDASPRGDRLSRGKTLHEISELASNTGVTVSPNQLSMFIDLAVDAGVIVPITVTRNSNSPSETLTRAYRHGEETYIVQRDLALFHAMLQTMAEDVTQALADCNVQAPSFGHERLGRILTEKALVLFVRYAISQGIFPRVYADAEDTTPGSQLVGIGYDMFGARVAIGEHKPTQLANSNTFVSWLLRNKILLLDSGDGYVVNNRWNNPYGVPDAAHLTSAQRFAAVISSAVKSLAQRPSNGGVESRAVMKAIDRAFVTLTTCESEASTLMAIGAELRRFDDELLALGVSEDAVLDLRTLVTAKRFVHAVFGAMNSGYLKLTAFIHAEAESNAQELSSRIAKRDKVYAGLWDDIWRAVRREQSGRARDALAQHLSGAVSILLKGLLIIHFVRAVGLAKSNAIDRVTKSANKSLKTKLRQLAELSMEARQIKSSSANDLAPVIDETLDWFKKASSVAPKELSALAAWSAHEMCKLRVRARDQFEWIDGVTSDDGRISRLKEYDSILVIRTNITAHSWEHHYAQGFASLVATTTERYHRDASSPRAYSQATRKSANEQGDFYVYGAREIGSKTIITFLADGRRGAMWLGYMKASITKLLTKVPVGDPLYISSVALLGLEDSRRIYRDFDSGTFVSPSTAKALVRAGHKRNEETSSSCAVLVDGAGKEEYGPVFIKEASETLRRKLSRVALEDITVPEAGGAFTIENLVDGESSMPPHPTTRVAWALIVEDELAAVLRFLEDRGIEVVTSIRNDGIVVGDALVPHERGATSLRIFISFGQGNTSIGNLLSNICTTDDKPFKFIVVSGICCSFSDDSSLTKVVLPTSALDMQIWRRSNEGRSARAEGRPMPPSTIQLIRWYLALRGSTHKGSPHIIDNAIMVSDNDLLRVDSKSEEHRSLAHQYSDKAIAYDMETAGVANWGYQNPQFPPAVVIKGLSDFGRSNKADDENRIFAARNAIEVSLDFILVSSRHGSINEARSDSK